MKIAWLFPGQGSQKVGMGRDLNDRFTGAKDVFARADEALPFSVSKLCFDGPEADLTSTANLQPALVTTSAAIVAALLERYPDLPLPTCAAGHSLGEYSALVAAGALDLGQAVRTVHERGSAMQRAVPQGQGAMLAVIGGTPDQVAAICDQSRGDDVLSPANFNCPGQIVIAGHTAAIERARAAIKEGGLKGIPLKVSAPFHCALMRPATERMREVLQNVSFGAYRFPVFANFDARANQNEARTMELLVSQIEGAVRFEEIITQMVANGVTKALELGPGQVLAGLVRKTTAEIEVLSVSDPASLEAVAAFLDP